MKTTLRKYIIAGSMIAGVLYGCSKNPDTPTPDPVPPVPPVTPAKTCIVAGLAQYNSGSKAELALTVTYNSTLNPTRFIVFDSASNSKVYDASFSYATADSIRIDANQYIKLDASKRVSTFVTLSDLTDVANADVYKYVYGYDASGYLVSKNLYVNGSATASYISTYTYTANLLTKCVMTVGSNSALKVLESTLTYDANTSATNWLYLFPDGFESIYFTSALNFGTKPAKVVSKIVTTLYNPVNNAALDTWTTNYGSYVVNSGYVASGTATGDLQQGIPGFYGKTSFYYQCQ